jgi:uncharacterized protein YcbK (DUF882 family)
MICSRLRSLTVILFFVRLGVPGSSAASLPDQSDYQLHLYNIHTRERLDLVYRHGDQYDSGALALINQYLRDYRTGAVHEYDPHVFDLLHDVVASVRHANGEIQIVCGYRTPHTNELLRAHGHRVARHSLHMQGMAIDVRVPGVSAAELRDAAWALHRGGVGYYADSSFVHIDTGRVRRW